MPPPKLHQSLPAHLTTHDRTILPRPPTLLYSNTSVGLPLAQMIPQTQLNFHQLHISTFKLPFPPETATVNSSTVNIQLHPSSIPIFRPKPPIPTSSLVAIFTKESHSNSTQPYTIPQPNTMFPSPHQWTIHSNHTPPPSMATQPPLSTTSNLPVQTHILVPCFQP